MTKKKKMGNYQGYQIYFEESLDRLLLAYNIPKSNLPTKFNWLVDSSDYEYDFFPTKNSLPFKWERKHGDTWDLLITMFTPESFAYFDKDDAIWIALPDGETIRAELRNAFAKIGRANMTSKAEVSQDKTCGLDEKVDQLQLQIKQMQQQIDSLKKQVSQLTLQSIPTEDNISVSPIGNNVQLFKHKK